MTRPIFSITALIALGSLSGCTPQPPPRNAPDDMTAVTALRDSFVRTFAAGDAEAIGKLYTPDVVVMQSHQPTETGREAVVKSNAGLFSQFGVKLELMSDETVTMGDFGYDRGRYRFTLTPKTAGMPAPPTDEGRYLVLLHKEADGHWLVSRDIGSSSLPMPMPPAPTPTAARKGREGGHN